MRVIGLDVALARTGMATIEYTPGSMNDLTVIRTAVVETKAKADREVRLWQLHRELYDELSAAVAFTKAHVFIEQPGTWTRVSNRSSTGTVEALAMARGVAMLVCAHLELPVAQLTVKQIRDHLIPRAGGTAAKLAIADLLKGLRLYTGDDPDIADAVACAFAGAATLERERLTRWGRLKGGQ